MFRLFVFVCFLLIYFPVFSQECLHQDLSKKFDFSSRIERINISPDLPDSCLISITVINKQTKKPAQVISISSTFLIDSAFSQCTFVRSFSTGKNNSVQAFDNNFGDLVIADLNFDHKEDIAVKKESGGNGGPAYNYYIQNSDGNFVLDKFLSELMIYFPIEIDQARNTLKTEVHANAYEYCESTYKLNRAGNKWNKVRKRFLKYNQ
jgi:hypothetical protein